ncbi:HET-domain-containing protein [Thozetella sp. PMI_491]|nr:HET-domain-containing protein [Thozetella sp. PMI_491]
MRLLHVDTLELEEFNESAIPKYAILSHTWGKEEPVYEQAGFSKISKFAQWARNLGYRYIWIDTCCINKTSSAELSEAINSMFRWYKYADLCGAYMSDFKRSRWFTRGWTLQELLCPADLVFLNASWTPIGTKNSIPADKSITGIDEQCLKSLDCLDSFDIATRMYWSSKRETTKKEDAAYCLMGILGIKMPLLYGEEEQALIRLQEEVMNRNEDISSLAWGERWAIGELLVKFF